uniref:Structural maintenance of chromosomes protein n=1 Tax=Glossina brevipalpis TaxID=37001 RepID=A0A1A9VZJ6_9MUSC
MIGKRSHLSDNLEEHDQKKRKTHESSGTNEEVCEIGEDLHTQDIHALHETEINILQDITYVDDIQIPPPIPPYSSRKNKGPRCIIKTIECDNFKSFGAKVILEPFHHNVTAILGPNGSGKSNVMDSVLFVFGYRGNALRGGKISTLVHNSARYSNMNSCSVAIHFCLVSVFEDGSCQQLPSSEFNVKRTAFKNGSSFYAINDQKVQFKEVLLLLKKHGIDLNDGHFIVLQGELQSIALMKPKGKAKTETGMLEYLESVIGTNRYIEPLKKIMERVELLTEENIRKHDYCKLCKRAVEDLKQPYNAAIQYLRQENENARTKNLKIQKCISERNKMLESYTMQQECLKQNLLEHDQLFENLRRELEEKHEIAQGEIEHFENLDKKKEHFMQEIEKCRNNFIEIQQIMKHLNQMRNQNKIQLKTDECNLAELRRVRDKKKQQMEEYEKQLKEIVEQKTEQEQQLQRDYKRLEDQDQTKQLLEQRETLEIKLIDLRATVDKTKADLTLLESELKILKCLEQSETQKYESKKNFYEKSQHTLNEKKTIGDELKQNLLIMESDIQGKLKSSRELQQAEQDITTLLMPIRRKINEAITINREMPSYQNTAVDFLINKKIKGIHGILGRLGDLGTIDHKYDVAISTACDSLDSIIVDTEETTEKCIEYLKLSNLGTASFISLEKVKYLESHSAPFPTPENVPRLYDLLHVKDKCVLPAFYFALRDTLVVSDLEQGCRIAFGTKRYRVVTLNGEVIEISGAMSGGGNTQIRGKIRTEIQTETELSFDTSIISQAAIDDMQTQANKLQLEIHFNQDKQSIIEREIQNLKNTQHRTEIELQKILITTQSLETQLPYSFEQVEAQRERLQQTIVDAKDVKRIEAEIEIKKAMLAQATDAASQVIKQVTQIRKQIDCLYENTLITVQNNIKYLNDQIKQVTNSTSKIKNELTTLERNIHKIEAQNEALVTEILKAQDKLTELSAKRQTYDHNISELSQRVKQINVNIDAIKSKDSTIDEEIQILKKRETESMLQKIDIEQKLQSVVVTILDVKSQLTHLEEQLKSLNLQEIPNERSPQKPLKTYTEAELASHTLQDIQYKEDFEKHLLKNKPNLSCIDEYMQKRNDYLKHAKILEDITYKCNEMRELYEDVRKKRYNGFMEGFQVIAEKLKEIYRTMTQSGDAELNLVDSMDPFVEGISFSVRPAKKTWRNISSLSGGEKALSSLALLFAVHHYKCAPLYFMDEIDAELDFQKISIIANYLKECLKGAQTVLITLRPTMSDMADYLMGIYKIRDCSESVCLKNIPRPISAGIVDDQQIQSQATCLPTVFGDICHWSEKQNALSQDRNMDMILDGNIMQTNDVMDTTQVNTNLNTASSPAYINSQDSLYVHENESVISMDVTTITSAKLMPYTEKSITIDSTDNFEEISNRNLCITDSVIIIDSETSFDSSEE